MGACTKQGGKLEKRKSQSNTNIQANDHNVNGREDFGHYSTRWTLRGQPKNPKASLNQGPAEWAVEMRTVKTHPGEGQ